MKCIFTLALVFLLFFFKTSQTSAALLTVNDSGEIVWNVLSLQDEMLANDDIEDLSIREVANRNNVDNQLINIRKEDGKVKLSMGSGNDVKEIEVENVTEELIEIEERKATQKLTISKQDDHFTIQQSGTVVNTSLPIQVNPKTARLSLTTSSGEDYLYILPKEAIRSVLRARVITTTRDEALELSEIEDTLAYKIPGEKVIPVLNIYNYTFNVDSFVSAQTGELINVDAPVWYKIFGFLITQQF